ncbi:ankyrin repeat domain-containing protein [Aliiglaciecola sp. 2_MG-2023]|uniref:ankyrin repeat domain-containing protein n=1 Tax=unclassified Aliiglaciecola TaxID=2593648 RepID=UPI0026E3AD66|nr:MULTISPECIES: ankyrin repeat domain-containing protein [unclassified Aliiglaciecola]MDO6711908.1 ankyrin repeat domain-containing protein [Aliiglaciecola sp. 2_MG-2023]MDO6753118.1 ankyrin repeat domain-containing protein [Aliiglaciecola sp. 1_MG-2023]
MKTLIHVCLIMLVVFGSNPSFAHKSERSNQLKKLYFDAARNGDIELLSTFYNAGLSVNIANEKGYTALILSAYNGQTETVNYLLSVEDINPCQEDIKGNTALMGAIFKGNFRIAKSLMGLDCEVDQANQNGQTALMFATLFDRQEIIEELIAQGANVDLKDSNSRSLSDIAASQGNQTLADKFKPSKP